MGSQHPKRFHVKRVAIVGAGPCGLASAKYLRAQRAFDSVVVFEQQAAVGGVWNYAAAVPGPYPVPQTDPFFPPDAPLPSHGAPVFPSPVYDRLHANLPATLMRFSDQRFPPQSWAFPSRQDTHEYLLRYAQDVGDLIKLSFQVKSISLVPQDGRDTWRLEAQSTVDGRVIDDVFDAVVVANGHFAVPFIPDVANIRSFHKAHPSVITHSKQYRAADAFKDKKTVIVGNGPSGIDIGRQISQVSRGKALLSVRTASDPAKLAHTGCDEVPEIEEFLVEQRGVRFKDGRVETGIDAILYCTGFLYSYPFLPDLQRKLVTTGRGVHGLYKHLFCIRHPTLVFSSLNQKSAPWPVAEAQAAVFSAVWSNSLTLPSAEEMERWSRELYEVEGEALHVCRLFADGRYINELHDWVVKATRLGKKPPRWDGESFWQRSIIFEAKRRFEQQSCEATTLAELGFHYDPEEWHKRFEAQGVALEAQRG